MLNLETLLDAQEHVHCFFLYDGLYAGKISFASVLTSNPSVHQGHIKAYWEYLIYCLFLITPTAHGESPGACCLAGAAQSHRGSCWAE